MHHPHFAAQRPPRQRAFALYSPSQTRRGGICSCMCVCVCARPLTLPPSGAQNKTSRGNFSSPSIYFSFSQTRAHCSRPSTLHRDARCFIAIPPFSYFLFYSFSPIRTFQWGGGARCSTRFYLFLSLSYISL